MLTAAARGAEPDSRAGRVVQYGLLAPRSRRCWGVPVSGGSGAAGFVSTSRYGVATKFQVLDVASPVLPLPEPTANWLTCQMRLAVDGSGVAPA